MLTLDILVIGAGMSGLIAATQLQKTGYKVACVEKARGSGGRLSSKRIESAAKKMISFDLGCASFDAKTELFRSQIDDWVSKGVVRSWHYSEATGTQYVGVPRSSSVTRHLADQTDVHFDTRITEIRDEGDSWLAFTGLPDERKLFAKTKHIIFATPPRQAAELLPLGHPFTDALSQPIQQAQWVLMLNVKGHLDLAEDYYEFQNSIISRLILDESKPDRKESGGHQVWIIQADPEWTEANLEANRDNLEHQLVAELAAKTGSPIIIDDAYLHRWLYSIPGITEFSGKGFLNDGQGIWLCGDYLADVSQLNGVEAAFTSAHFLAKNFRIKRSIPELSA